MDVVDGELVEHEHAARAEAVEGDDRGYRHRHRECDAPSRPKSRLRKGSERRARARARACLSRNIGVALLLVETTGALGAAFVTILRILAKQTRLSGVAWTKVPVGFRYSVVKFPQSFRHFLAGVLRKQAGGRPGPTPS